MIHRRRAWKLPSALVGAAFLLGGGVPAWGAVQTFVVNSTADVANSTPTSKACATAGPNPVCTLRAAIQASNANSGTDTISLPAGVYTLTIAGRNEDAAATGDLDITDAVTVTGAGAGSAIIDGNGIDRVFDVFASGTTTISGVTIRNGNPGAATGGGILAGGVGNNVVSLNLSNVIVTSGRSRSIQGLWRPTTSWVGPLILEGKLEEALRHLAAVRLAPNFQPARSTLDGGPALRCSGPCLVVGVAARNIDASPLPGMA